MKREPYSVRELSVRTLPDFETLAIKQGGCWCIFYQRANPLRRGTTSAEWKRRNRLDKRALVRSGRSHAILVYEGRTPVGWCQYGGQEELPRIDARRTYRNVAPPVGVKKLWRITCFFVDPKYRGRGVAKFALHAALESIRKRGGGVVEAYPVSSPRMAAVPEWRWFGTPGMFRQEGFRTVAPLGTSGLLVRKIVTSRRTKKPR
jgi:GNAT superfamily N-acetyltransferase